MDSVRNDRPNAFDLFSVCIEKKSNRDSFAFRSNLVIELVRANHSIKRCK